jgi:hypothetical protein
VWRRISLVSSEGAGHDDPPSDSPVNMAEPSADASLGDNRCRRRRSHHRQHPKPQSPDPEQLEVCGNGKDASPRPAPDDGSFSAMPHPCVLNGSDHVSRVEHELRKALIVTVICDAQSVPMEAIFDATVSSFNVERSMFKIVPAGSKVFLVFLDEVLATRILSFNNQHPSENESFRLHFRRWTQQAFASSAVLPILVDVLMHGIPVHAWDLSTTELLLNPFGWIQEIHEVTRNRDDLSVFRVSVWCVTRLFTG